MWPQGFPGRPVNPVVTITRALSTPSLSPPPGCAQVGFFDDKVGPISVAVMVLITMVVIFILAAMDYMM